MKKALVLGTVAAFLMASTVFTGEARVNREPGGIGAFFIGCCWGIREGSEWNEGADLHWREWCRIIPYVGIIFAVWDGIDSYNGMTARQWAEKNGANWY